MATLQICDATPSGTKVATFTLRELDERLTVRELIRARIYQEVQDYNLSGGTHFRGLVQPTGSEASPAGFRFGRRRPLDWEEQYRRALEAFERNGFFVLVGDRQAESLDDGFEVTAETEVSFVKLVPLVGG